MGSLTSKGKGLSVIVGNNKGGLGRSLAKVSGGGLIKKTAGDIAAPKRADARTIKDVERSLNAMSIAFLFDATGSRDHSWNEAQRWQAEMIDEYASTQHDVEVGIIVHRGQRVEPLGWFKSGAQAKARMADIQCEAGYTRISSGLEACLEEAHKIPKAIVMVGDCCEENIEDIRQAALQLKQLKIPVHAFHEGEDPDGECAYKTIANVTGGVFAKFGPNMPLKNLVSALFVHTVKGSEEFRKLLSSGDKSAKALVDGGLLRLEGPSQG